jgi:hypothetical protein
VADDALPGYTTPGDEANQWPDGWLEHANGQREPVELDGVTPLPVAIGV